MVGFVNQQPATIPELEQDGALPGVIGSGGALQRRIAAIDLAGLANNYPRTAWIFRRGATPPARPTGGTAKFGGLSVVPTAWSQIAPSTGGDNLYAATATITNNALTTWSQPFMLNAPDAPTILGGVVNFQPIFFRGATPPAFNDAVAANGVLTTPPTGWSTAIPPGTASVWIAWARITGATINSFTAPLTFTADTSAFLTRAQIEALIAASGSGPVGDGLTQEQVEALIAAAGHLTSAQVMALIDATGHLTTAQVNALIAAAGHLNTAQVQALITTATSSFLTEAQITARITAATSGFLTQAQIQALIDASPSMGGGLTQQQAQALIDAAGHLTSAQVQALIDASGHLTQAQSQALIEATTSPIESTADAALILAEFASNAREQLFYGVLVPPATALSLPADIPSTATDAGGAAALTARGALTAQTLTGADGTTILYNSRAAARAANALGQMFAFHANVEHRGNPLSGTYKVNFGPAYPLPETLTEAQARAGELEAQYHYLANFLILPTGALAENNFDTGGASFDNNHATSFGLTSANGILIEFTRTIEQFHLRIFASAHELLRIRTYAADNSIIESDINFAPRANGGAFVDITSAVPVKFIRITKINPGTDEIAEIQVFQKTDNEIGRAIATARNAFDRLVPTANADGVVERVQFFSADGNNSDGFDLPAPVAGGDSPIARTTLTNLFNTATILTTGATGNYGQWVRVNLPLAGGAICGERVDPRVEP